MLRSREAESYVLAAAIFGNFDRFKIQLGLPTQLPLVLDKRLLDPFELNVESCGLSKLPERLDQIEFEASDAVDLAIGNRLDLMNARASLVDYWRKIEVSANGLMGILDIEYTGNWFTPDPAVTRQPFNFRGKRSRHAIGLQAELPFVRKRERNIYRATLIEYQRARRDLMQFEDVVRLEVRNALRELIRAREDFEIQRGAVILACRRVDQTRRILQLPPRPGEERELGTNSARDLLDAQQDMVDAQNDLVESWVDYQTSRLELLRDIEMLDVFDPSLTNYGATDERHSRTKLTTMKTWM